MTATQLALGIFFGFGSLELLKYGLHTLHHRRQVAEAEALMNKAEGWVDKMHREMVEEREALLKPPVKKRRAPATKKAAAKKPVAKGVKNVRRTNR